MARPRKQDKKVRITVYISKQNYEFIKNATASQGAIIDNELTKLREKHK